MRGWTWHYRVKRSRWCFFGGFGLCVDVFDNPFWHSAIQQREDWLGSHLMNCPGDLSTSQEGHSASSSSLQNMTLLNIYLCVWGKNVVPATSEGPAAPWVQWSRWERAWALLSWGERVRFYVSSDCNFTVPQEGLLPFLMCQQPMSLPSSPSGPWLSLTHAGSGWAGGKCGCGVWNQDSVGENASLEVLPYAGLCGIKPGREIKKW